MHVKTTSLQEGGLKIKYVIIFFFDRKKRLLAEIREWEEAELWKDTLITRFIQPRKGGSHGGAPPL